MASVVVTMDAREQKLFQALDKLVQKQAQLNSKFDEAGNKGKSSLDKISASIGKAALQYISLQGAMQVVNSLSEEYLRLQEASLQATQRLASAQTGAVKNLQGLNYLQKKELMTTDVANIQRRTGFPNRDLLAQAIGAGISAGGSPAEVLSAVEAAARLNVNTPNELGTAAAGAVDLARATGVRDAERNLGFLLTTGAVSRVESSDKLANALGRSLGAAMQTVPNQDQELAAREAAGLFAVLNRAANDKQGDSTATALITLAAYLRKVAGDRADTLSGRLAAVAGDSSLRAEFLKSMPGEAAFKLPFEQLVTQQSAISGEFKTSAESIKFSADAFKENADQLATLTPELAFGTIGQSASAAIQAFSLDPRSQARAQLANIAKEVIPAVRPGGIPGLTTSIVEQVNQLPVNMMYQSPEAYASYLQGQLQGRRRSLTIGGVDEFEARKIELIDATLKSIEGILSQLEKSAKEMSGAANNISKNQNPARAQANTAGGF